MPYCCPKCEAPVAWRLPRCWACAAGITWPAEDTEPPARTTHPRQGWFWLDNAILDTYGPHLGAYGLAVYVALCRHADKAGYCWPSYATLATETHISRTKVITTIERLVQMGLIRKEMRYHDIAPDTYRDTSNAYFVLEIVHHVY